MTQKPTLFSVAEKAQVSIASVSRVINGQSAADKTRERVERAISELGYQPNFSARALKVKSSEQICVILPDLSNPVFQSMIRGIQYGFRNSKYRVMLATSASTSLEIVKQLKSLGQNYADGLIMNALSYDDEVTEILESLRIPLVILGTTPKGVKADSIRVDNEKGVYLAIEYLRSKGRKKILFVNGPQFTVPAKLRKSGFIKSLTEFGVPNPEKHLLAAKAFTAQAAIEALSENFQIVKKYDSIVCANDLIAAGVLRYLSDKGIKVPEEIAIVGIDNTDLAELLNPSITSIDFRAEYRGELAANYMQERLGNPNLPLRKLLIEPELKIRKSA